MTYEETWDRLLAALRAAAPHMGMMEDVVQAGRYREHPTAAPFCWLYLEPGDLLGEGGGSAHHATASGMIFIGTPPQVDSRTANVDGHNRAVEAMRAVHQVGRITWSASPITLDEIGPLMTVYRVEFTIAYDIE